MEKQERARLIEKFITDFHLSVHERKLLGKVYAKEIIDAVKKRIQADKKYPGHIEPHADFTGTVIYAEGSGYIVLTKSEIGFNRFSEIERNHFYDLHEAATHTVSKIFSSELDGIKIYW